MAKLAAAYGLGPYSVRCESSSLSWGTLKVERGKNICKSPVGGWGLYSELKPMSNAVHKRDCPLDHLSLSFIYKSGGSV